MYVITHFEFRIRFGFYQRNKIRYYNKKRNTEQKLIVAFDQGLFQSGPYQRGLLGGLQRKTTK